MEEIADNVHSMDLTDHLRRAADILRQRGDAAGEARLLRKAIGRINEPSGQWRATLTRLDELVDAGAVTPDEMSQVSLHVGRTLTAAGDPAAASERARCGGTR